MSYKETEKQKKYQREWRRKRNDADREKAFSLLGGKCNHCGIVDFRVLQIDHIIPVCGERTDRDAGSRIKQSIANGLRNLDNLQLLCANCHSIKCFNESIERRIRG